MGRITIVLGSIAAIMMLQFIGYRVIYKYESGDSNISKNLDSLMLSITPTNTMKEPQKWQNVGPRGETPTLVFSAYERNGSIIIITIYDSRMYRRMKEKLYCQLWTHYPKLSHCNRWKLAEFSEVPERFSYFRYAVGYRICNLSGEEIPDVISIVTAPCESPQNFLKVLRSSTYPDTLLEHLLQFAKARRYKVLNSDYIVSNKPPSKRQNITEISSRIVNFTMCVLPMYRNYNNVHQLVEMIEMNRILGADRFIFYNYSIGADVNKYLQDYIKDGIAEVVQWKLPRSITRSIIVYGQHAALNDCIFRAAPTTRFIVNTDHDEFIIPRYHTNWFNMLQAVTKSWIIENLNKSEAKLPGAFVALNTFFLGQWGQDKIIVNNSLIANLSLRTQLITNRDSYIYPYHKRSKYIIWPRMVLKAGIHHILEYVDSAEVETLQISPDVALLHHYRIKTGLNANKSVIVRDTRMHAFSNDLVSRAHSRYKPVNSVI